MNTPLLVLAVLFCWLAADVAVLLVFRVRAKLNDRLQ